MNWQAWRETAEEWNARRAPPPRYRLFPRNLQEMRPHLGPLVLLRETALHKAEWATLREREYQRPLPRALFMSHFERLLREEARRTPIVAYP